jgi:transposase-like protein
MDGQTPGERTCPACGSGDYTLRGRKQIEAEPGKQEVETKYRCKACNHEWKMRTATGYTGRAARRGVVLGRRRRR